MVLNVFWYVSRSTASQWQVSGSLLPPFLFLEILGGLKRETKWQWNWFTFSVHCNHGSQSVWNSVEFFFLHYSKPLSTVDHHLRSLLLYWTLTDSSLGFKCESILVSSKNFAEAHSLNNYLPIMHHCQWNLPLHIVWLSFLFFISAALWVLLKLLWRPSMDSTCLETRYNRTWAYLSLISLCHMIQNGRDSLFSNLGSAEAHYSSICDEMCLMSAAPHHPKEWAHSVAGFMESHDCLISAAIIHARQFPQVEVCPSSDWFVFGSATCLCSFTLDW